MESELHKRALSLSYFTVGFTILGGIISVIMGLLSGSIALVGFGLDSFIESLSAGVMIWRFRKHGKISEEEEERVEKKAVKFVAFTFFILAAYILYESVENLYFQKIPNPSLIGIVIAVISLRIMPIVFIMKYETGKSINSRSLIADSKQTLACIFMSVALLIGLGLNYLFNFWQADPIVGILIAIFLIKEGYFTLKEAKLCRCSCSLDIH